MAYSEETRRVILKMREILSGPEDWTQGEYFRNRRTHQAHVSPFSKRAKPAVCLLGAVQLACGGRYGDEAVPRTLYRPVERVLEACAGPDATKHGIIHWNDSHTWADVDSALNCAVAKVTEEV